MTIERTDNRKQSAPVEQTTTDAETTPMRDAVADGWDEIYDAPLKVTAKGDATNMRELLIKLRGGHYILDVKKLKHQGPGIAMKRYFTKEGVHPYDEVEWETRSAKLSNDKGEIYFEQNDLEFPTFWSQMATNVVVSKYFRGKLGEATREKSLRDLIDRVAVNIAEWGLQQGMFSTEENRDIFRDELTYLLLHQRGAFNSPVWFNVGQEEHPQCSACFINSVDDTMQSIMDLAKTEGMLFKYGSGTGTNLSALRSSREHLSTGGVASGPVSFMKGYDAFAGVIKSGGKTRRAAKMVILDIEHPDITDFIECKVNEEKKAWALIDQGYDGGINGEAYGSVFFQNSNNSVRVPDDFMQKVDDDDVWYTKAVTTGKKMDTFPARGLLRKISEGTHICGDPGMQFDTTINKWNPCSDTMRINASNPCSEYMFADNSACNLASLNLMTFLNDNDDFDAEAFKKAVETFVIAQEIIVDNASYPRDKITWNSHLYRPLGLGYTNLGAVLMTRSLPYDSDAGRAYASAITAIMTGHAYATSARISAHTGPFKEYDKNRNSFINVIRSHRQAVDTIDGELVPETLLDTARQTWDDALETGSEHGFRNAQVSVIAPTGTISFMMDADTTGIEPDLALIKYKKLVGGGTLTIVNQSVPRALRRLGYADKKINDIVAYIDENQTIEGSPHLDPLHLPVFDCALRPVNGQRFISHMGHLRMMGACQPFISGAISKTVNMPEESSVDDIMEAYTEAWRLGLKAVAIYRDNSKRTQPLNTGEKKAKEIEPQRLRHKLADERQAITHKFSVGGHEGYVTVGTYEDGAPGEIFLLMSKEGSTVSGLMDGFATMTSLALQYGVPLEDLVEKFSHMRFEPAGFTQNPEIPMAKSIYDYIFRWLGSKFLTEEKRTMVGNQVQPTITNGADTVIAKNGHNAAKSERQAYVNQEDAPGCPSCGTIMVRSGSCYMCTNCGTQHGCS